MASESENQSSSGYRNGERVLLFPFMAQGHIIPFVGLARLLEHKTPHTISIINTPLNIQRLRSSLPPSSTIQLLELPFHGPDHGLPPDCDDTASLPSHLVLRFLQASESLQPSFHRLLSDLCNSPSSKPPLCIISDEFMAWTLHSATEFGVSHAVFNTSGAYGTAIFMSVWTHLPHREIGESVEEFSLPDFPETTLKRSQLTEACRTSDGSDPWAVMFRKQFDFFEESGGILVNSVEGLERKGLEQLRKKNRCGRVWAIGPLFPPPSPEIRSGIESDCIEWLDLYTPHSVLYVSFGSQSSVGPLQMMELAKGLEGTSHAFIWVIRPPIGFDVDEEFRAEWLPEGFEDRITKKRQGILVKKWAPQLEILAHESTGAFLSHCGWNSVLESLSCGKPIIGWPMSAEQPFNSKLVVDELGVGVEIARGSMGEICSDDVAGAVEMVMGGESAKGEEMRRKAKEIAQLIKAAAVEDGSCQGSSVQAIEDFIQSALSRKEIQ